MSQFRADQKDGTAFDWTRETGRHVLATGCHALSLCVETVNTTHKRLGPAACLLGRFDQARDKRLRCNTVSESRLTRGAPVSRIKAAPILIGRCRMTATCWPLRHGRPTDSLCVGTFRTTRLRCPVDDHTRSDGGPASRLLLAVSLEMSDDSPLFVIGHAVRSHCVALLGRKMSVVAKLTWPTRYVWAIDCH